MLTHLRCPHHVVFNAQGLVLFMHLRKRNLLFCYINADHPGTAFGKFTTEKALPASKVQNVKTCDRFARGKQRRPVDTVGSFESEVLVTRVQA